MIQFYLNLETFDFMNVAQFHIFLSAQANFPLFSAMYLQKAKALQDEETGKRRLQINLGGTFLATRRKKKVAKTIGSHHIDLFGSIWGYQKNGPQFFEPIWGFYAGNTGLSYPKLLPHVAVGFRTQSWE